MNAGPDDIYRVNEQGERVTWETCACWGCTLERQMRTMLDLIDERYKKKAAALSFGHRVHLDPDDARRIARAWGAERWQLVQTFTRAGWHGCLAAMVIVLPPSQREPRPDVEAERLGRQDVPADLDHADERDGADEPHRDA